MKDTKSQEESSSKIKGMEEREEKEKFEAEEVEEG